MTANRAAASISVSPSRVAMPCRRDFSASSRTVMAMVPEANEICPTPAITPAARTTNAAISVVASTSWRLPTTYAITMMPAVPARTTIAGPCMPDVHHTPLKPAMRPIMVNVRSPANRALWPEAWPLHSRSSPTARPPSTATTTFHNALDSNVIADPGRWTLDSGPYRGGGAASNALVTAIIVSTTRT